MFGGDGQAQRQADFQHMWLLFRWNTTDPFPRGDVGRRLFDLASHRPNAAEQGEK